MIGGLRGNLKREDILIGRHIKYKGMIKSVAIQGILSG